jgi:HxlR-like helix-turn-helix
VSLEEESPLCRHYREASEIIGKRWVPQILRGLLSGVTRYTDLKEGVAPISDALLSDRLKELEIQGIVDPGAYQLRPHGQRPRPGRRDRRTRGVGRALGRGAGYAVAASATARASSMMPKPSWSCSSVMHSGGFVMIPFQRTIVNNPRSIRALFTATIVSLVTL